MHCQSSIPTLRRQCTKTPPSTTPSPPTRSTNRSRAKAPIAVDRSDSIDTSHGDADESAEAIISDDCQLLFVMPTVADAKVVANYLNSTLDALLCQLRSATHESLRVCIGVFEPRPQAVTPTPFELARRSLAKAPANVRNRVLFVRASDDASSSSSSQALRGTIRRALKSADDAVSRLGKLGLTKRQTVDVARMLLAFQTRSSRYLVLMEDDWLLCDGGMDALRYLITKASLYHGANNWAALRFSYGLNGILVQTSDILPLAKFLLDPGAEADNPLPDAPVDHLTYRWLRGKYASARSHFGTRRIIAFRHTLFWHVGDASAVGNTAMRHKPSCYAISREWLFEQEAFHPDQCPNDDIWPCEPKPPPGSTAAASLEGLVTRTVKAAGGASNCGQHRVCWNKPPRSRASARCRNLASTPEYASLSVSSAVVQYFT